MTIAFIKYTQPFSGTQDIEELHIMGPDDLKLLLSQKGCKSCKGEPGWTSTSNRYAYRLDSPCDPSVFMTWMEEGGWELQQFNTVSPGYAILQHFCIYKK